MLPIVGALLGLHRLAGIRVSLDDVSMWKVIVIVWRGQIGWKLKRSVQRC